MGTFKNEALTLIGGGEMRSELFHIPRPTRP